MGAYLYDLVWVITAGVLHFLTAFPAIVIYFCSLCIVRRRTDPARRWLFWFKTGFILFAISNFFHFVVYIISALFNNSYSQTQPYVASQIRPGQIELDLLGNLISSFSVMCIILALSGLDNGIIVAHKTTPKLGTMDVSVGEPDLFDRVFFFSTYGLVAVMAFLTIFAFGIGQHICIQSYFAYRRIGYNHAFVGYSSTPPSPIAKTSNRLSFSVSIMALTMSVALTAKSIHTKVRSRKDRRVTMASTYLIVCSTLFILRAAYTVGYSAAFGLQNDLNDMGEPSKPAPIFAIVDVVVDCWPTFVIFCILFALGCKKRGLWSTKQPFTPGLLRDSPEEPSRTYSESTSRRSEPDAESNTEYVQMHEILHVASQSRAAPSLSSLPSPQAAQTPQSPLSQHAPQTLQQSPQELQPPVEVSWRLAGSPQTHEQQIRETLVNEADDDLPPDYYSPRHQIPPQNSLPYISQFSSTVEASHMQTSSSFALPAQSNVSPLPNRLSAQADGMGLYHQADGRIPQSETLPYNEKK